MSCLVVVEGEGNAPWVNHHQLVATSSVLSLLLSKADDGRILGRVAMIHTTNGYYLHPPYDYNDNDDGKRREFSPGLPPVVLFVPRPRS